MTLQEYLGITDYVFTITFYGYWYHYTPEADVLLNIKTKEKIVNKSTYTKEPLSKQLNIPIKPYGEIIESNYFLTEIMEIFYNDIEPIYKESAVVNILGQQTKLLTHYWSRLPQYGTIFEYVNKWQDLTILDDPRRNQLEKVLIDYNETKSFNYSNSSGEWTFGNT